MRAGPWAPTDDLLIAFDRGLLPEEEMEVVESWLASCPEGEERLRGLTWGLDDEVIHALRSPVGISAEMTALAPVTERVLERLLDEAGSPSAEPSPMPSSIREYQLLGLLGEGGMGCVYRAWHTRLRREAAVKLLNECHAGDPQYCGRFEWEMAVMGQLDHPNLVRAHDAGVEDGRLFLAMELLDGANLFLLVEASGPLPLADACESVRQAALGLHFAHQHGIVHRDVKPANLFLTCEGTVKVIDLGLARLVGPGLAAPQLWPLHDTMGTPSYMAPEQWDDAPAVDQRADIYGLGGTLFFLLTGQPPFAAQAGDSSRALLDAHRWSPPPCVRGERPDVPVELARLVARMLAKEPAQRPASARELAEALAPFTTGHELAGLLSAEPRQAGP